MTEAESECWASAQRWHERTLRAEAEIERLQAALHGIMEATDLDEVGVIARRALEPKS